MVNKPLVSVIMPAYNVEEYINQAIESVIAQTFGDWELLIIDDCSTDDTRSIVRRHLDDPRIHLMTNEYNLGGAESRNKGIASATGRFIAFLDSDDIWFSMKLEVQIAFMLKHDIKFSFSNYNIINEEGVCLGVIEAPTSVNFDSMLRHNFIGCLTAVYDRDKLGTIFFPNIKKRQDFALWLKIMRAGVVAYNIGDSLAEYRIRKGSLSRKKLDALKYYWIVLRTVARQNRLLCAYYILQYIMIVVQKKFAPRLYKATLKILFKNNTVLK